MGGFPKKESSSVNRILAEFFLNEACKIVRVSWIKSEKRAIRGLGGINQVEISLREGNIPAAIPDYLRQ